MKTPLPVVAARRQILWLGQAVRIFCFLAIALGISSLVLTGRVGASEGFGILPIPMDDALGLIFTGFALRMARLEPHRVAMSIIVKTSRYCLIVVGGASVLGIGARGISDVAGAAAEPLFASGLCFLILGIILTLRRNWVTTGVHMILAVLLAGVLLSCWAAMILTVFGVTEPIALLRMPAAVLVILSAFSFVLCAEIRIPGLIRLTADATPENESTRLLFPMAFAIPLGLAILRRHAEANQWIGRDAALLVHVLLSAASMGAMILWISYRASMRNSVREKVAAAVTETEAQMKAVFDVVTEPVWIFSPEGKIAYRNARACRYVAVGGSGAEALGAAQQQAILSACLFRRPLQELQVRDLRSGKAITLDVALLRTLYATDEQPRGVLLVGRLTAEAAANEALAKAVPSSAN